METVLNDTVPTDSDYTQLFITTTEVVITSMTESPSEYDFSLLSLEKNQEYTSKHVFTLEENEETTEVSSTANYSRDSIAPVLVDGLYNNYENEEKTTENKMRLQKLQTSTMADEFEQISISIRNQVSEKSSNYELLHKHSPNSYFSKCTAGQFQCENGTSRNGAYCINLDAKFGSENDCSEGSDELN